jgi:lipoprotein-releasing system permease protein
LLILPGPEIIQISLVEGLALRFFFSSKILKNLAIILAILSIALGTAIIEIAISVTSGFEKQIQAKVTGFVSDIQIKSYFAEAIDTLEPLKLPSNYCEFLLRSHKTVSSCYPYLQRSAILKSGEYLEGIELKGVSQSWDSAFIYQNLKQGKLIHFSEEQSSQEILVSKKIASRLSLSVGDKARLYFLERGKVRVRPVRVSGIYETGLLEFDQTVVFCDIRLLQKLVGWSEKNYQGLEIHLKKPSSSQERFQLAKQINLKLGSAIKAYTADQMYEDIFQWLSLQRQHVFFILVFMIVVAIINMAGAMIILIIEKISFIGLLKALGATHFFIQKIFLFQAFVIISLSVGLGNLLAFVLLYVQDNYKIIAMDPDAYFLKTVPIDWAWGEFLKANLLVIGVATLAMFLPTVYVTQIEPSKALKIN